MKTAIYILLLLTLPLNLPAKQDTLRNKADETAVAQTANQNGVKDPPPSENIKHDTVYVAVKELPEDNSSFWISVITIALTFGALGTTIWSARKSFKFSSDTLMEMKAQRSAAYKPEIFLSSTQKYFVEKTFANAALGLCEGVRSNITLHSDKELELKLFNLGGIAEHIELAYEYDLTPFLNVLTNVFVIGKGKVKLDYNLEIEAGLNKGEYAILDYMLQTTKNNSKYEVITLPAKYFVMFMGLVKKAQNEVEFKNVFSKMAPIIIIIQYYDIHGAPYRKELIIEFANTEFLYGLVENQKAYVNFNLRIKVKE